MHNEAYLQVSEHHWYNLRWKIRPSNGWKMVPVYPTNIGFQRNREAFVEEGMAIGYPLTSVSLSFSVDDPPPPDWGSLMKNYVVMDIAFFFRVLLEKYWNCYDLYQVFITRRFAQEERVQQSSRSGQRSMIYCSCKLATWKRQKSRHYVSGKGSSDSTCMSTRPYEYTYSFWGSSPTTVRGAPPPPPPLPRSGLAPPEPGVPDLDRFHGDEGYIADMLLISPRSNVLCCCVESEPHHLQRKRACLTAENSPLKISTGKLELFILKVGIGYLAQFWRDSDSESSIENAFFFLSPNIFVCSAYWN